LKILKTEMSNSLTLNIKKQLHDDIKLYCKANNIENIDLFCTELLEKGFMVEKYGTAPEFVKNVEKKPEPIVYEPEKPVSLPEQPKIPEPPKEEPKKVFKKATLNDDYRVYDKI
jgi:hypothetical protein